MSKVVLKTKVGTLDRFLETLETCSEECRLKLNDRKGEDNRNLVYASTNDAGNIMIVVSKIKRSAIDRLKSNGKEVIGVNVEKFRNILGSLKNKDNITLEYDGGYLDAKSRRNKFKINTISESALEDEPNIPDIDFDTKVSMSPKEIVEAIDLAKSLGGGTMTIEGNSSGKIDFLSKDDTGQRVLREVPLTGLDERAKVEDGKTMVDIDYLDDIRGIIRNCNVVEFMFADEMPVKLIGKVKDNDGNEMSSVGFMIAPRIE